MAWSRVSRRTREFLVAADGESGCEDDLAGPEPDACVGVVEELDEAEGALESCAFDLGVGEVGDVLPDAFDFGAEGGVAHPPHERAPPYLRGSCAVGEGGFGCDVGEGGSLAWGEGNFLLKCAI